MAKKGSGPPADGERTVKQLLSELDPALRRSLSDDVVDRLRTAIIRGRLDPGQHLSEAALAETFSVSRGPIREALAILEREGLLTVERHRGARVTRLSRSDVDEIYELRRALERLAVDRAVLHADADDFAAMELVVKDLALAVKAADTHAVVEADVAFHDCIYRAAKHGRLYQSWSTLRPQIETYLNSRSVDRGYLKIAVSEHQALLDAIRAKSRRTSQALLKEHIRTSYERLTEMYS